ncbi:DUF4268 domain-containing protein [Croceicoccus mobilis]|uniref:DUF4268 domain-containing protein n=1 Tax=Croceicoccus mobilis TaxID=1703339 RepID=A0A916YS12_9SPHN|nr:DUF4268 domain-containing protein [Croceicoccus mobilis]GGD58355.1 hypothetical protein GCM10010990_04610 [Croceicoccus mobilis]
MIVKLGKVERVNLRAAWPNEASHFTPWLASEEGLELLQDTLDMDLEVEATEKFVGPFKADILAKRTDTTDDHWVLIENQLEKTDHRHLGQLLTYAAGLDAATIVWVAETFSDEHRAALDWLNDITSEKFEFFGLEIELWQIGNSDMAPQLNIVAEPNEWVREVAQGAAATQVSDLKEQQHRYWQSVRSILLETKSPVRPRKARPRHYANYAIGRSGTWISACVNSSRKSVWVEFAFRGPPGKLWFDELASQREQIETAIGQPLDWQRLDGKKMCRIVLQFEGADPTNEVDWARQHAWVVEKLELFQRVFRPHAMAFSDFEGADGDAEEPEDA